jgi:hypothetical protein
MVLRQAADAEFRAQRKADQQAVTDALLGEIIHLLTGEILGKSAEPEAGAA